MRGLQIHVNRWAPPVEPTPDRQRPLLVMVHGWMDVGASFQFVVDALQDTAWADAEVVAPDWRGFGLSQTPPTDTYWFPDYLGDLDALLDTLSPDRPVDLVGHSMGGNVVMSYAGLRPGRIRRLINLEGFGLPRTAPEQGPKRMQQWLDELKTPMALTAYDTLDAVARRLMKNNPRLRADRAAWLAAHWARQGEDGRWHILGDPAHKRTNPVLYRVEEVLATWRQITAPVLWIEGAETNIDVWWGGRFTKAEFHERLAVVPQVQRHLLNECGHMLHHDQPEAVARLLADFLVGA